MINITKEYLEKARQSKSYAEIAREIGCDVTTVYHYRRKFGIEPSVTKGRAALFAAGGWSFLNLKISNRQRALLKMIAAKKALNENKDVSVAQLVRDALDEVYFQNLNESITWTDNEVNFLRLHYRPNTPGNKEYIAKLLDRSADAVGRKARRLGLNKEATCH